MCAFSKLSVSVVIPCHNYANFLPTCLQSIIGQTCQPQEIIVVDDASTDNPELVVNAFEFENLSYHRVDYKNELLTRKKGISLAKSDIVCCIDPDDTIDPRYLENGLRVLMEDYRIAIAYSDYEYSGLMQGRSSFPASSLDADIELTNYIHAGSMFRRDVALFTDAFELNSDETLLYDWYAWKNILRAGFLAVKHEGIYKYFRHENSNSVKNQWKIDKPTYYKNVGLSSERVSICMLVDESYDNWEQKKFFLEKQQWNHEQTNLQLFYIGKDEVKKQKIRNDILSLNYCSVQFESLVVDQNNAPSEIKIMQTIADKVYTEYFLFINSCIIPPLDSIKKLMQKVCEITSCVNINLASDHWKYCAIDEFFGDVLFEMSEMNESRGMPFFCTLFRKGKFKEVFKDMLVLENISNHSQESLFYNSLSNTEKAKVINEIFCTFSKDKNGRIQTPDIFLDYFDEKFYLDTNKDVSEAVKNGIIGSGKEHFISSGRSEGREFRLSKVRFDEDSYFKTYPSVMAKVNAGQYKSAYQHYIYEGKEGGLRGFYY